MIYSGDVLAQIFILDMPAFACNSFITLMVKIHYCALVGVDTILMSM